MEQEWEFIKRHRNAIVTYIVGCIIYSIIYGGFVNRTEFCFDETLVENHDTIFLATGRWVGYLFRAFLGHGPCYPIAGIMGGLLLNAAILIQQRLLGLQRLWQMLSVTTLYLSFLSWHGNLSHSMMCDFFAASILLTTIAAYYTPKQGYRNYGIAVITLTLALCCYQSAALCYMALVLLLAIREIVSNKSTYESWRVLLKSLAVFIVAFLLYYASSKYAYTFASPEIQAHGTAYQAELIGWYKLSQMNQSQAIDYVIKYIVTVPFKGMVGGLPQLGQRLYGIVWIPGLLLIWQTFRKHGIGKGCLTTVFCCILIYIPFLFCAVMLNDRGSLHYICMAQPIVLCGVWALGVFVHTEFCYRHRYILGIALFCIFVKYAYVANVAARDKGYNFDLARQEMHDMSLLAKVEEEKSALSNASYLVCGTQAHTGTKQGIGGDLYPNSALPTIMDERHFINAFAPFFRLPKLRAATDEELAMHAQALSQMPLWPAVGSVKADGDAVLIKIAETRVTKSQKRQ